MIAITGATGNTARPAVEALLEPVSGIMEKGEKVRVIGRDAVRMQAFAARGAEPCAGNVEDAEFCARAFDGADTVYLLIPQALHREDFRAYQERVGDAYASAAQRAGVGYAVALSSVGAQHAAGTGPIAGLHNFEQRLNAISGLNVLHLRPTFFMENLLMNIGSLRMLGILGAAMPGEARAPWIAAKDVGHYAARRLRERDFSGKSAQELLGERDLTMNEIARVIGPAIGKPNLSYMQVPLLMLEPALAQMGLPKSSAALIIEMYKAGNAGILAPQEPRSERNTTPTSIEWFAAEVFAPAYLGRAATADLA